MSGENPTMHPLLAKAGPGWKRHTPRVYGNSVGEDWLVCAADRQPWPCVVVEAYRAGREDAARDIEDAYDVARGTLRRGALRKAVRIARGQQPAEGER